jgi:hypothetical protein
MREDLPAPVRPQIAKRSREVKSITVRLRKAVKPSSSSLSGLTSHLIVQSLEELEGPIGRGVTAAFAAAVEIGKQLDGRAAVIAGTDGVGFRSGCQADALDMDGVRQVLADDGGQVGEGNVDIDEDAEPGVARFGRDCGEVVKRNTFVRRTNVAKLSAGCNWQLHWLADGEPSVNFDKAYKLFLSNLTEVELQEGTRIPSARAGGANLLGLVNVAQSYILSLVRQQLSVDAVDSELKVERTLASSWADLNVIYQKMGEENRTELATK